MYYTIKYNSKNSYESPVKKALWQFLIIPENNQSQQLDYALFTNSLQIPVERSINGYGFESYRIQPKTQFSEIEFNAEFKVYKEKINPFDLITFTELISSYDKLNDQTFKVEHSNFLKQTPLTTLPKNFKGMYPFDKSLSIFDNLIALNQWIFDSFTFKTQVTDVGTGLAEIIANKCGVCQDFTHLLCAISRYHQVPARYVSGYLHQGHGYFGDSQMHAWVECFIPGAGWIGFDPTNNLLAAENHIKVLHGKDYTDCPPIKGVVYTSGKNETVYTVAVNAIHRNSEQHTSHQQMQQQQ